MSHTTAYVLMYSMYLRHRCLSDNLIQKHVTLLHILFILTLSLHNSCEFHSVPTRLTYRGNTPIKFLAAMLSNSLRASRMIANCGRRQNTALGGLNLITRSFATELGKGLDLLDLDCYDKSTGKRRIQVKAFGETSFRLDETLVKHSVLLLPHSFLLWNAKTFDDITQESLEIFTFMFPTLEILFIGCGEVQPKQLPLELVRYFRSKGIVVEATSTSNAAGMFNVLNAEGRNVGAALLTQHPSSAVFRIPGEFA